MATRMVMMEVQAHNDRENTCPFGLLMDAQYGEGVSVLRCHKPFRHKGPCESSHSVIAGDGHTPLHIRVQWIATGKPFERFDWSTADDVQWLSQEEKHECTTDKTAG